MLCNYNPLIESTNFVDGIVFGSHDPCLWVVYPAGASGDLLISIIDKHYLQTGCEYLGINDHGKVMFRTSDYNMMDAVLDKSQSPSFDQQWFYDFSEQLGERNLTYSMLDQVIFGCHMIEPTQIQNILDSFPAAKVINVFAKDAMARSICLYQAKRKILDENPDLTTIIAHSEQEYQPKLIQHPRLLNLPYGFLFDKKNYNTYYETIRNFLGLQGPLIDFAFIEFYLSKQQKNVASILRSYGKNL